MNTRSETMEKHIKGLTDLVGSWLTTINVSIYDDKKNEKRGKKDQSIC